ncbi:hypothetical protein CPC08DRAFT_727877 [Agrocybe pediades]|nr:hypothetical protein CPC08DRAFT_727877 [Agrocybe pediades]
MEPMSAVTSLLVPKLHLLVTDGSGEETRRNRQVREWAGAPNLGPTQATANSYLGATSAEVIRAHPHVMSPLRMRTTAPSHTASHITSTHDDFDNARTPQNN